MTDNPTPAQAVPDRDAELAELQIAVQRALDRAAGAGVEGCEVTTSAQGGLEVAVRLGEVETIEHTRDRGITVSVYRDGRKGHASSAELRPAAIDACVDQALEIARFTERDPCNGLAAADRLATVFPDLDLWHPVPLDAGRAMERALAMEAAGLEREGVSNSEGASVSGGYGLSVYGNANGVIGRSEGTRYAQSCVLIAGSSEGMQRDYWWDAQRCIDELEAPTETGRRAAERTVRRLGARQLGTRRCPVVFAPEVARSLLGHFVAAVSGSALYRNASFLRDAAGE
ncbi:MAG: metallopeptidase TldD-related protein, partial [Gammaproteobacteria bacterium]